MKDRIQLCGNLIEALIDRGEMLAIAESCTGGMLSEWITEIPGASAVFAGSCVVYSNEAKIKLLSLPPRILEKYGAVSEQCAYSLARNVGKVLQADWGLSITGIAG